MVPEGGRPDALRPTDLNRPETTEKQSIGAPTPPETKSGHVEGGECSCGDGVVVMMEELSSIIQM
ncbi:hypothetical protein A2U01_0006554, partial [Trifolium medium]|nr:hypothetical protein [Trifolium medium]